MTVPEPAPTGLPVGFKRHLRVETVAGEAVYLLSERGTTVLRGPRVEALAPLLDGTRTLPAVLAEVPAALPADEAGRMIAELARADLVGYHGPGSDTAADAYWELAGVGGPGVQTALGSAPVEVVALGRTDGETVRAQCLADGLTLAGPGRPAVFTVVFCDDYLDPELAGIDARHRAAGLRWLPARTSGTAVWVGPVFGADGGPCWHCLAHRLRGHRSSQSPVRHALGLAGPVPLPEASLAAGRLLGVHTAVLEAQKWLAGVRYPGQEAVCALDTRTLSARHHPVTRRPQCPVCGDPGLVGASVREPYVPVSRPVGSESGGTHRALSPAAVLARYGRLIDPVTGVVAEVRPAPGTPEGLNHYVSGRNLALRSTSLNGLRNFSGGKGITAEEAEAGALCEAVERYCGTRQGDEPVVRDSLTGLGDTALHPNACQLYAERQFQEREAWNASRQGTQLVPPRFRPDAPTDWTPVWSLTAGRHRLLPTSMLYFGPAPNGTESAPWADSNGNAAGGSVEDAVVQGFLELVERDAVALWWYNRLRRPAVDLDSFDEPWLARTRTAYARAGRELWVLDLTADFGIPVMAAVSRRTRGPAQGISFGFGAHFDPGLALRRAVTEMSQLLPPEGYFGPSAPQRSPFASEVDLWWHEATVDQLTYLTPDPAESPRGPGCYTYVSRSDMGADVVAAEAVVRHHGMELMVLNQTRPDLELPVVKVLVPGMRHFWARYAPGRLFDIPVTLGWRSHPMKYNEINPLPLFV
ncbi:TOMM precursor leader peptide-binding protein [Streptomyces sp. NPDC056244]|uniref:TOMM precursor leader peptide-binding protein n=1 Tax=Streptomyces sp. NPDC056244 TaxID=3345762 RepID=UPI0035E19A5E